MRRYSVTSSKCLFFNLYFSMLAWDDGQHHSVLFIFFLTRGSAAAQSAHKHRLNSCNQSRLGTIALRDSLAAASAAGVRPSQHVLLWPPTALL